MTTRELLDEYAEDYNAVNVLCNNNKHEMSLPIERRMQEIEKELEASIGKQYGGCTNCYGKGYCTNIDVATGRGISYLTLYYLPCDCGRGKQIIEMQASIRKEVVEEIWKVIKDTDGSVGLRSVEIIKEVKEYALSKGITLK